MTNRENMLEKLNIVLEKMSDGEFLSFFEIVSGDIIESNDTFKKYTKDFEELGFDTCPIPGKCDDKFWEDNCKEVFESEGELPQEDINFYHEQICRAKRIAWLKLEASQKLQ